jgi:thymidylate kinase
VEKILPDVIFYLDVDIVLALSRTFDHGWDKFEKESRPFYKKIIRGYEKCAKWKKLEWRFVRIHANRSEEEIFQDILSYIKL